MSTIAVGGVTLTTISSVVHSDPDILGGTPVFVGTRVPIRTLIDYLAAGDSLEEFLDHFPTVSREQVVAALEQANDQLCSMHGVSEVILDRAILEIQGFLELQ